MNFIGNQAQPSVATAVFTASSDHPRPYNTPIELSMFLPGTPSDYRQIACDIEFDSRSSSSPYYRVRRLPVTVVPSTDGKYASILAQVYPQNTDNLNTFQFVCSFIAPNYSFGNVPAYGKVNYANQATATGNSFVYAWSSPVSSFEAFDTSRRSAFKFSGVGQGISGKQLTISNPGNSGTTSTIATFSGSASSYCDVYWDGALYQNSAAATITPQRDAVTLTFGSPLNAAQNLVVYCDGFKIMAYNPYLPTTLKLSYTQSAVNFASYSILVSETRPFLAESQATLTEITATETKSDFEQLLESFEKKN